MAQRPWNGSFGSSGKFTTNCAFACLIIVFVNSAVASAQTVCNAVDRAALLSFKEEIVTTNKSSPCLSSWTSASSCCAWTGVQCDNATGHVVSLNLTNCALDGALRPSTLSNVSTLEVLDLSNNNLQGNESEGFLSTTVGALTKLLRLDLGVAFAFDSAAIKLQFPTSVCQLGNLSYLNLSNCNIQGPLPACLGSLSGLQFLDLSGNDLRDDGEDSTMLDLVGNLTKLQTLAVDQVGSSTWSTGLLANVSGSMDAVSALSRLRSLQSLTLAGVYGEKTKLRSVVDSLLGLNETLEYLNLRGNALTGVVPHSIIAFKNLRHLDLGNNSLSGTLTSSLFQLGHLQILHLDGNEFSGPLPSSIGDLGELRELNVTRNYLSGPIPDEIGKCGNLTILDVSNNTFNSSLPGSIGNLTNLRYLSLLKNSDLGGDLPEEIANLSQLEFIDISHDAFTGMIPESWGLSLKRLQFLHMTYNHLSGVLPASLGNLTSLISLDLSYNGNITGPLPRALGNLTSGIYRILFCDNKMTGEIPPEWNNLGSTIKSLSLYHNELSGPIPNFTNFKVLEVLDLSYNQFTGQFPAWLENSHANLRILELSANSLTGPLPSWLPTLTSLQIMNLGTGNSFTGLIPEDLSTLTTLTLDQGPEDMSTLWTDQVVVDARGQSLEYDSITINIKSLDLNHNSLTGHIPNSIGTLQGLYYLSLAGCNLSGSIPTEMGNLTNLVTLDLSVNDLSGAIPQELADNLTGLQFFNVSSNNLSGPIPQGHQFASLNASSFDDNPLLCGPPLAVACDAPVTAAASGNGWGDVIDDTGFAVGLASGFLLTGLSIWCWIPARMWVLQREPSKDAWYGHFKQLN